MLLRSPKVQLIPFDTRHWAKIAEWYYSNKYPDFFRHHPNALKEIDFRNFDKAFGSNAEVFCIMDVDNLQGDPVGIVNLIPDVKLNRGFLFGIILDETAQHKHFGTDVTMLLFDYAFNRLGYRKGIMEILESNIYLKNILEKYKFLFEGRLYGDAFQNGEFVNELRYCMFASYFNKHIKEIVKQWQV